MDFLQPFAPKSNEVCLNQSQTIQSSRGLNLLNLFINRNGEMKKVRSVIAMTICVQDHSSVAMEWK